MTGKEIQSINHIDLPSACFASQQMQYLGTFIHDAQELSYRINVSKYILLHHKTTSFNQSSGCITILKT